MVDLELGQIEVPQAKLTALQHMLDHACRVAQIPARRLASIIGKIISMGLAIGPVSRFMTRSVYAALEARQSWCDLLRLSPEARTELEFWVASLADYNSQPIWHSPSAMRVCILMLVIQGMVGMWWSMAPVWHLASGRLRRPVGAPRCVSSRQCGGSYCP